MVVLKILEMDAKAKTVTVELLFPDGRVLTQTLKVEAEFHFHP